MNWLAGVYGSLLFYNTISRPNFIEVKVFPAVPDVGLGVERRVTKSR